MSRRYDDDHRHRRSSRDRDRDRDRDHRHRSPSDEHRGRRDQKPGIGKKAAEKSGGLFSADDWMCKSCGNVNWARRTTCNMCSMPKVQKTEVRTGAGGGYNERDNVEYHEHRAESDGEYDEFGRKKKKYRDTTKTEEKPSRLLAEDEEDDEEDDDDDFDAKKYALDSDEDEHDDDKEKKETSKSRRDERRRSRSRSPVNSSSRR